MGRVVKKKGKGFHGMRPAEISRESANVSDLTQASSSVSSDQREGTRPLATTPESGVEYPERNTECIRRESQTLVICEA